MPRADCTADTLEPAARTLAAPPPPCATAPPAATVSDRAATIAVVLRLRERRRALRASARRARERRLDSSHCAWLPGSTLRTAKFPLVSGAYGVSCRARAWTCATPHTGGDSPRGAGRLQSVPPLPAGRPAGTRLGGSWL